MPDNKFVSRKEGEFGTDTDAKSPSGLEGNAKRLREKADGWESKSFDEKLFNTSGVSGNDYCYPDEYNDESGPAWPSHSAK